MKLTTLNQAEKYLQSQGYAYRFDKYFPSGRIKRNCVIVTIQGYEAMGDTLDLVNELKEYNEIVNVIWRSLRSCGVDVREVKRNKNWHGFMFRDDTGFWWELGKTTSESIISAVLWVYLKAW